MQRFFLRASDPAGAVAAGSLQPFLDGLYDFLVFIELDSHGTDLHFPICGVVSLADVDWTELYQYRQSGGRECNDPASIILSLRKMATSCFCGPLTKPETCAMLMQTVEAEITLIMLPQRVRVAENRMENKSSNGPRRAQSKAQAEYSAT